MMVKNGTDDADLEGLLGKDSHPRKRSSSSAGGGPNLCSTGVNWVQAWVSFGGLVLVMIVLFNATLNPTEKFGIQETPRLDPLARSQRFPSIEERVKFYMSNWYLPPCDDLTKFGYTLQSQNVIISSPQKNISVGDFSVDTIGLVRFETIEKCRNKSHPVWSYCEDIYNDRAFFFPNKTEKGAPILAKFGDRCTVSSFPFFDKYRRASRSPQALSRAVSSSSAENECTGNYTHHELLADERANQNYKSVLPKYEWPHLSPIVWKLKTQRHFGPLTLTRSKDIPWNKKVNVSVWRGGLNGQAKASSSIDGKKPSGMDETCNKVPRCNLVRRYIGSSFADVSLVARRESNSKTSPTKLEIWAEKNNMMRSKMSMEELLQFKMVISIEGNDISSGLKWMLLSNSVVLMAPPTLSSWAMEELLEPFAHYVPLNDDASNLQDMVQWVLDNDDKAHRIAQRATLFIEDLVFHPDAKGDDMAIKHEIMKRYRNLWRPAHVKTVASSSLTPSVTDVASQSSHDGIPAAKAPKSKKDDRYAMLHYCSEHGVDHNVNNTVSDDAVNTTTALSEFPALETLVDGDRIIGDVSHLLSFAVIGFSKCGTSFIGQWIASSPDVLMMTLEDKRIGSLDKLHDFVVQRYKEMEEARGCSSSGNVLSGLKVPVHMNEMSSLVNYATYFNKTKLIVNIRHPVSWFQSYYNYKFHEHFTLPSPFELVGSCLIGRNGTKVPAKYSYATYLGENPFLGVYGEREHLKGVCTDRAEFHRYLARFAKTPMDEAERKLLRHYGCERNRVEECSVSTEDDMLTPLAPFGGKIFLIEITQLFATKDELRRDLSAYLGTKLNDVPGDKINHNPESPGAIDICEGQFAPIRSVLLQHATRASDWIVKYFLESPDVVVSSRDYFVSQMKRWKEDPCDSEEGRRLLEMD